MTPTFRNLSEEKKNRIIRACIDEFSEKGYEASSISGIVRRAGISKGGIYEYISSKEELYRFILDTVCRDFCDFIFRFPGREQRVLPADIPGRLNCLAGYFIDYYFLRPASVRLITGSNDSDFLIVRFSKLFSGCAVSGLQYPPGRVYELAVWLLFKIPFEFPVSVGSEDEQEDLKRSLLQSWQMYPDILREGIGPGLFTAKEQTGE